MDEILLKKRIRKRIWVFINIIIISILIYIVFNDYLLIPFRFYNFNDGFNSITIPSDGILISRTLVFLFLLNLIIKFAYYLINSEK